jgi:DNA-binding Lrp family transcriptional regulator
MPVAFLLVNVEIDSENEVLEIMKRTEGVEEAYIVYGVYDIVAKIKADTTARLKDIILWRIRKLNKVRSTTTMMVIGESDPLRIQAIT